jgi:hypothetical protein
MVRPRLPLFGRQATLNVATYYAPVSNISAGQRRIGRYATLARGVAIINLVPGRLLLEPGGEGASEDMTYYEAALEILRSAQHPLTTREITDRAIERGLITPHGKTPNSTMAARLYVRGQGDTELVKLEAPGNGRAKRGSVRWTVRHATTASQSAS